MPFGLPHLDIQNIDCYQEAKKIVLKKLYDDLKKREDVNEDCRRCIYDNEELRNVIDFLENYI